MKAKHCLAVLSWAWCVATASAQTFALIDTDTTIDTAIGPIGVANGPEGPPTVRIVSGGSVEGVSIGGESSVILDGGDITFPGSVGDNATFTMLSGQIDCTAFSCLAVDVPALFIARSSAVVEFRGGVFGSGELGGAGTLWLQDQSTARIYGTDLAVSIDRIGGRSITGVFPTGELIDINVFPLPAGATLELIEVPEASTLTAMLFAILASSVRTRRA